MFTAGVNKFSKNPEAT